MSRGGYVPPVVTVDTVCFALDGDELVVLTIRRNAAPFAGRAALPGVYMQREETIVEASDRCLHAKAGITLPGGTRRTTIDVRDRVGRDPRGRALSIVTLALVPATTATTGAWRRVDRLGSLAFDHAAIVADGRAWCARHLWSDTVVFAGLTDGPVVSAGHASVVAGAIVGSTHDRSNLRRRLSSCGLFTPVDGTVHTGGVGRPSSAWRLVDDA